MPVKTRVIHSTNAFGALEIPCTSGLRIVGVHPVVLNNRVGVITYLGARRCWGGNVAIGSASCARTRVGTWKKWRQGSRSRSPTAAIPSHAWRQSVRQAVILAAGLDARAWRLPWMNDIVVYENDQPKALEFKAETLRSQGAESAICYIAVLIDPPGLPKGIAGHRFRPSPTDSMVGRGPTGLSASKRLRRVCSTVSGSWPAAATCQGPTAQASPHPGTAESFTLHRSISA